MHNYNAEWPLPASWVEIRKGKNLKEEIKEPQLKESSNAVSEHKQRRETPPVICPYPRLHLDISFGFFSTDDPTPQFDDKEQHASINEGISKVHNQVVQNDAEEECHTDAIEEKEDWQEIVISRKNKGKDSTCNKKYVQTEDGLRFSVKVSGCCFVEKQKKTPVLYGGGKTQSATGRQKKVNLKTTKGKWFGLINVGNEKNLKENGPYGEACVVLGIKNTKANRKRLSMFKSRNSQQKPCSQMRSCGDRSTVETPRYRPPHDNKKSPRIVTPDLKNDIEIKKSYCICKTKDWKENGVMVECESCETWFHYKCICKEGVKINRFFADEKHVKFICGLNQCNFRQGILMVKGTSYPLKSNLDIDIDSEAFESYTYNLHQNNNNIELPSKCTPTDINMFNHTDSTVTNNNTDFATEHAVNSIYATTFSHSSCSSNNNDKSKYNLDNNHDDEDFEVIDNDDNDDDINDTTTSRNSTTTTNTSVSNNTSASINTSASTNTASTNTASTTTAATDNTSSNSNNNKNSINNNNINSLNSSNDDENIIKHNIKYSNIKRKSTNHSDQYADIDVKTNACDTDPSSEGYTPSSSPIFKKKMNCTSNDNTTVENIVTKTKFNVDTISEVLGIDIPSDFFIFDVNPRRVSYAFDKTKFDNMLQLKKYNSRYLRRNTWEHHFIEVIRKSNPYCVFIFKWQRVSNASQRRRKLNTFIFQAYAECKFSNCTCKVSIKMSTKDSVILTFVGNVKHSIHEMHSRPLSGLLREEAKQAFKPGQKPLPQYLKKLSEIPPDQILAGNLGVVGKDSKKIAQVAVESRQSDRFDHDVYQSLLIQQAEMKKDTPGGFIQKISILPMYVLFWSNFGIQMYNDCAKSNALFWDATGSIVKKDEDGKRYLYYELAIASPIKGKMGIPISSMITCEQSLPIILDWIRSFRHAEKNKLGYSKIVTHPKLIISDQSMVFILAALKEFNNEDMGMFLKRAFLIAKGNAPVEDTTKTIVHLCKSHYLHNVKRYLKRKDVSIKKINFCLFIIGLLMKCNNLQDFAELIFDVIITLSSKVLTDINERFIQRLLSKINSLEPSSDADIFLNEEQHEYTYINPNMFTEEEFQVFGSRSPFKTLVSNIERSAIVYVQSIQNENSELNQNCCEIFLEYLFKNSLPLFPLWSPLLFGDLSRFNVLYKNNNLSSKITSTNSTIENRFRILKHICLNNRSKHRLDEFSEHLKTHTISIQKFAAMQSLKEEPAKKTRRKKLNLPGAFPKIHNKVKKSNVLIEEKWNKKGEAPENFALRKKSGKYVQPPIKSFQLHPYATPEKNETKLKNQEKYTNENTYTNLTPDITYVLNSLIQPCLNEICKFKNYGSTCWLNASLQAFFYSNLACSSMFASDVIEIDQDLKSSAVESTINIWKYMVSNQGSLIPENLLKTCLTKVCSAIPGFTQNRQQDAHEFVTNILQELSNRCLDTIEISYKRICTVCKKISIHDVNEGQSIVLPLQLTALPVSVQTLLDNYFLINDDTLMNCSSCNKNTEHKTVRSLYSCPETLIIILTRYGQVNQHHIRKLHNPISISEILTLSNISKIKARYRFKSVICHDGDSITSGHYTAAIKSNNNYICCNDSRAYLIDADDLLNNAYVLVYNKDVPQLPKFAEMFLKTIICNSNFKDIRGNDLFKCIPKFNQFILTTLIQSGYTERVSCFFDKALDANVNNNVYGVLKTLIHFLLPESCGNAIQLYKRYFKIQAALAHKCSQCSTWQGFKHVSIDSIVEIKSCENYIPVSLKEHCLAAANCHHVHSQTNTILISLPEIMIFVDNNPIKENNLLLKINFSDMSFCYLVQEMDFYLQNILGARNNVVCDVFELKDGKIYDQNNGNNISQIKFHLYETVLYIYSKIIVGGNPNFKLTEKKNITVGKQTLMCRSSFSPPKRIHTKRLFGVSLDKRFYTCLTNKTSWLSSNHINIYLSIIAENCDHKVHVIDCGWPSKYLFLPNGQIKWDIDFLESKTCWMEHDFIVIPLNENMTHWTIVVIDIKHKIIVYTNSFGQNEYSKLVILQMWRYFCFEALMHSSTVLHESDWSVMFYSKTEGFPRQTDGSSCGVYVCAVAKALLFDSIIPCDPNLINFRFEIAQEIANY